MKLPTLEELKKLANKNQLREYKYLQKTYARQVDIDIGYRYLYISILQTLLPKKYVTHKPANTFLRPNSK